jgi:hypothetical protein
MNRKIRIEMALGLALVSIVSAFAPLAASATPLLSGYGGPGAGEQAIVGSMLLGGARGGGSSGGSSDTGGPAGSGAGAPAAGGSASGSSSEGGTSPGGRSPAGSSSVNGAGAARGSGAEGSSAGAGGVGAHVYRGSSASSDLGLIGITDGDVLPIVGIVVALILVGVFTLRFVRLQP